MLTSPRRRPGGPVADRGGSDQSFTEARLRCGGDLKRVDREGSTTTGDLDIAVCPRVDYALPMYAVRIATSRSGPGRSV
jgi:hypothetical protein